MDDLFTIISSDLQSGNANFVIAVNPLSEIFEGHFPGQPVLPGACLLQLVKNVLELTLDQRIRLTKADQIKFLGLIDPQSDNIIHLKLIYSQNTDSGINLTASIMCQNSVCFKFKGNFLRLQ